jgi:3-dehydroquinate synthase
MDTGARRALNFGHTFAHAIEKRYNYKTYNHGEAVAIGMVMALAVGASLGITAAGAVRDVTRAIAAAGLTAELGIPEAELVPLMMGDKKNSRGTITLILLKKIGEPIVYDIEPDKLARILERL